MPEFAPKDLQEPKSDQSFDSVYAQLLPPADLPEKYKLPESDCPVMLCKVGGVERGGGF